MKIHKFTFNSFYENTYIVWNETDGIAAVIDPGMEDKREEEEFKLFIAENSLKISYLINTHCHLDHLLGCRFVKDKYDPVYFIPEKDLPLFKNANMQAQMFGVSLNTLPEHDKFLSEDEQIVLGDESIINLFTVN